MGAKPALGGTYLVTKKCFNLLERLVLRLWEDQEENNDENNVANDEDQEITP